MVNIDFVSISKKVKEAYNKYLRPLANEINISNTAFEILIYLSNNPKNNTSVDICRNLCLKSSIVSFHVENLVKENYLERVSITGDRRKYGLIPTDKAVPVIEKARIYQEEYIKAINKGLSQEDIAHIHKIFKTIEYNIDLINKGGKQSYGNK